MDWSYGSVSPYSATSASQRPGLRTSLFTPPALSSFINQATAADEEVEQSPPVDVNGNANPSDELVEHPFAKLQLSTSEVPGKHKLSTADKLSAVLVVVVVFWNNVDAPDTKRAGNVASCSSDGGEFDVDSDSQGLVLTSPDSRSDTSVPVSGRGLFAFGSAWSKLQRGEAPPPR